MNMPRYLDASRHPSYRLVMTLLLVTLGMFGFGFALVPLYNAFCEMTGLNGKTGRVSESVAATTTVDRTRTVTVEFVTQVSGILPWEFQAGVKKMQVHPGEINGASFYARNYADRAVTGQAVPSVTPGFASKHFSKTECFCFTQQTLQPGESREMPVRFIVDPQLPRDIHTITLSYTFFHTHRAVNASAQATAISLAQASPSMSAAQITRKFTERVH
jgi:cytochrome c oxidase assembly protein subunit 11